MKEFEIPTQVNSASFNSEHGMFVCGGEDFKMYKFNYNSGEEVGECCKKPTTQKCHFFKSVFLT